MQDKEVQSTERRADTSSSTRADGYVNLLNKYGTKQDNSEAYQFQREPEIPDMQLTSQYEGNGLFTKIIDFPAEEAVKHGFSLGLNNSDLETYIEEKLDELEWEEKAATAIKWARLYGGAVIVMMIDDGRGLEEPVNWQSIQGIDELLVYERPVVQPDYASLYLQDSLIRGPGSRASKFGQPEYFRVNSIHASFTVHESRCLVFRNGVLPESSSNSPYRFWGMPEFVRIRRALRETITAHTDGTKLLERSVQAIYKMQNLSQMLATDEGEKQVLQRMELIDMARGILSSMVIDSDGEDYDFKSFSFAGVRDVIDATCNMLSALTNIPQTLLFGRSPAGMNATGDSDLENYYNFVEHIQKQMLKRNLRDLLDIAFRAGTACGMIDDEPKYKLTFNPLWSMSESEQAAVDKTRADTAMVKAQTAQVYVDMQALDPSEVRRRLAADEDFDVEDIITEEDGDLVEAVMGSEAEEPEAAPLPSVQTDEDGDWITVNGARVQVGEGGEILKGPEGLKEALNNPEKEAKNIDFPQKSGTIEGNSSETPNSSSGEENGQQSEEKASRPAPSATGENVPCAGFASKAKLKSHAKRHSLGVGAKSEEEYQQKGIAFLAQPCGGDIIGYSTTSGKVVRFNTKTCEYASGTPGENLYTYMSPKCDKRTGAAKPDQAMEYFNRYKESDIKEEQQ